MEVAVFGDKDVAVVQIRDGNRIIAKEYIPRGSPLSSLPIREIVVRMARGKEWELRRLFSFPSFNDLTLYPTQREELDDASDTIQKLVELRKKWEAM